LLFVHGFPQSIVSRLHHSYLGRIALWQKGLVLFSDKAFLWGIGPGISRYLFKATSVHNSILTTYLETGILGGSVFVASMLILMVGLIKKFFRLQKHEITTCNSSSLFLGILIGIMVGIVNSMVEPLLGKCTYDAMFWSLVAIGYAFSYRVIYQVVIKRNVAENECFKVTKCTQSHC